MLHIASIWHITDIVKWICDVKETAIWKLTLVVITKPCQRTTHHVSVTYSRGHNETDLLERCQSIMKSGIPEEATFLLPMVHGDDRTGISGVGGILYILITFFTRTAVWRFHFMLNWFSTNICSCVRLEICLRKIAAVSLFLFFVIL